MPVVSKLFKEAEQRIEFRLSARMEELATQQKKALAQQGEDMAREVGTFEERLKAVSISIDHQTTLSFELEQKLAAHIGVTILQQNRLGLGSASETK